MGESDHFLPLISPFWSKDFFTSLPTMPSHTLRYPKLFHLPIFLDHLGRDRGNCSEELEGGLYKRYLWEKAFPLESPFLLRFEFGAEEVVLHFPKGFSPEKIQSFLPLVERILGFGQPLEKFYLKAEKDEVFAPLVKKFYGARLPLFPSLWEALVWAILGQQIHLSFAYKLRHRLVRMAHGFEPEEETNLLPFPCPEDILRLEPEKMHQSQISRSKTRYLLALAQAYCDKVVDEKKLRASSYPEVVETLKPIPGLGPWSMAYGALRGLGFWDAIPQSDAGLINALRKAYKLEEKPSWGLQEKLLAPFKPYRGLAVFYLWRSL